MASACRTVQQVSCQRAQGCRGGKHPDPNLRGEGRKQEDGVGYRRRRGGVPVAAESAEQHTERAGGIHDGGEQRQRDGLCAATAQRFWRIYAGG
nr:MAG TPA: hypothetical protein [Caudoviricetes sp.]